MGQTYSQEDIRVRDELSKLKQSVLFTDWEMSKLYKRFVELGGSIDKSVPLSAVVGLPEFRYNPFRYRIARVFGEDEYDGQEQRRQNDKQQQDKQQQELANVHGAAASSITRDALLFNSQDIVGYCMSFDSFVKLLSSFSYRADAAMKTRLAFAIYDFDGDGYINVLDIECMLNVALGATALHNQQYRQIAYEVMSEVDVDNSGTLTEVEFQRVVARLQDFVTRLTVDIQF